MAQLQITYNPGGVLAFQKVTQRLGGAIAGGLAREALSAAGNKTMTLIRRALFAQMGTKQSKSIREQTSGRLGYLEFVITGTGKGLPIEEFPVRGGTSERIKQRFSRREHWKLQIHPRAAHGRWGKIKFDGVKGGVTASPWRRARTFKRSFASERGYRALLPNMKTIRRLYGPAVGKELVLDQSAATFESVALPELEKAIMAKMARFV